MLINETGPLAESQAPESQVETVIHRSEPALDPASLRVYLPEGVRTIDKAQTAFNPFDPKNLIVDESSEVLGKIKGVITTVPVRKPGNQEYIRVHRDPNFRAGPIAVIEFKDEKRTYIVSPLLVDALNHELYKVTLYTAFSNASKSVFLWPVRLPKGDVENNWNESAREAALIAVDSWVRVKSDVAAGQYVTMQARGEVGEPEWPELSFMELLQKAFKGRFIDSLNHAAVRKLEGC
jgi:hypothetical protein